MASTKRIAKEFGEVTASPPAGMKVVLANEADMKKWNVTLTGPAGTPYAGGTFGVVVELPVNYPFKPPTITFTTRIYHPNITNDSVGNICLSALKSENWKPTTKLLGVLEAVRNLLVEPQPDDPLEARIADEFRQNRAEFDKNVKHYVERYAKNSSPSF